MAPVDSVQETGWIRAAVTRFEGPLTLYAARLTGDPALAQDVVQETFFRLCRQERASVEDHLAEWLFTVCRNEALDARRKERRMQPLTEAHAGRQASAGAAPPEALERSETLSIALAALNALPRNQQEVLRLKFQHGLSYKEISRVTELSVTNVGFLIHTGLKAIRERMTAGQAQA